MNTALTVRLGLAHPIIQAPMAGTSTPSLAAAVSNAGALGSIAIGSINAAEAGRQIAAVQAATDRPFNVNVFCHADAPSDIERNRHWIETLRPIFAEFGVTPPETLHDIYPSFIGDVEKQALLLETRPAVVSFHFGLPDPGTIAALKSAGVLLLATATTPAEGHRIQDAGIDMVIAQGVEAGGHRGVFDPASDPRFATLPLARLLVRELTIPVIAAGGIMDGAGIVASLALGATGAQLGTAFVSCPESSANAAYRAALAASGAELTRISAAISGRPARGIENAFMRRADEGKVAAYPYAYDLGKALNLAATALGETGYAPQWAGQAAPLTRALPAADLVTTLVAEMAETLARLAEIRRQK